MDEEVTEQSMLPPLVSRVCQLKKDLDGLTKELKRLKADIDILRNAYRRLSERVTFLEMDVERESLK